MSQAIQNCNNVFGDAFLLDTKTSENLYNQYIKDLPIIDYHNHLEPKLIASNEHFTSPTSVWLDGDHYKWRAMRNFGMEEFFISGDASDLEKFKKWSQVVPYTLRNPLFHWTHMEMNKPFGIQQYLNETNADEVYHAMQEKLQQEDFTPQGLLKGFKVEALCTTDDPIDTLEYHTTIRNNGCETSVLPAFRPDNYINIVHPEQYLQSIRKLEAVCSTQIFSTDDLLNALNDRIEYFHQNGAQISDHGFEYFPDTTLWNQELETEFSEFLKGNLKSFSNPDALSGYLLKSLCKIYSEKGWVQQFHVGATRNNNSKMLERIGVNSGYDAISDQYFTQRLSVMLDELNSEGKLAKTIIYTLNSSYNEVLTTMAGNFNEEGIKSKVQFGAAWWFLDQLDGMKKQLDTVSNLGLVSTFVGMLTDSRSFLSYSRHEYFRRLICQIFGKEMENGLLPNDEVWIGKILQDICYHNTKNYFDFK